MNKIVIPHTYYYIHRGEVYDRTWDGPTPVFASRQDAQQYADAEKSARIAELRRELADLEGDD